MLQKIEISNFRSCNHVVLDDIRGVLALVGRNGAGKTNILRAIEWAGNTATSTQPVAFGGPLDHLAFFSKSLPEISLTFSLDDEALTLDYFLKINPSSEQPIDFKIILEEGISVTQGEEKRKLITRHGEKLIRHDSKQEISLGASTPSLKALIALLAESDPIHPILQKTVGFLERIRYYSLDRFEDKTDRLIQYNEYKNWESQLSENGHKAPVVIKLINLFLNEKEKFDEICSLIGDDGLGLISSIEINELSLSKHLSASEQKQEGSQPDFYYVNFTPRGFETLKPRAFGFNDLSFGTQRILTIVASIIFDGSSVFLLEQPEDGIHVGLLHKLQPLFEAYSSSTQFILSSHSRDVLDRFNPRNIRLVSLNETSTELRKLLPEEIEQAEQFMDEEGPLSDFIETVQED